MTRMERRRRRQREARIRIAGAALLVLVSAALVAVAKGLDTPRQIEQETAQVIAAPVSHWEEAKPEITARIVVADAAPRQEEEPQEPVQEEPVKAFLSEQIPLNEDIQAHLVECCDEFDVPYSVALGVIQTESSFMESAENGSCFGYMQINSINSKGLLDSIGITDIKEPYQNIRSGVFILSDLYGKYGSWDEALIAYNCGEGGAYEYYFSKGIYSSEYSRKVLGKAAEWESVLNEPES